MYDNELILLIAFTTLLIAFLVLCIYYRAKMKQLILITKDLEEAHHQHVTENEILKAKLAYEQQKVLDAQNLLNQAEKKFAETFQALSYEALNKNTTAFLQMAEASFNNLHQKAEQSLENKQNNLVNIVKPIEDKLKSFDEHIIALERSRQSAYNVLYEQVKNLSLGSQELKNETKKLVGALKSPNVRGRWGEMQLKRTVEIAGLVAYCDFIEQQTTSHSEGLIRPDMIIKLPGEREIIVDAKVPLISYLEAQDHEDDSIKSQKLKDHAKQLRGHIQLLSHKKYWAQFKRSPEFVILFLPGEVFYSSALEHDPSLLEWAIEQKVIIATPTTLIGLLRGVSCGWREHTLADNVAKISELGKELYHKLSDMLISFGKLGKHINGVVENYNQVAHRLQNQVLVRARKFHQLDSNIGESLSDVLTIENFSKVAISSDDGLEVVPTIEEKII